MNSWRLNALLDSVGAGLLANRVDHAPLRALINCVRQQAGSYRLRGRETLKGRPKHGTLKSQSGTVSLSTWRAEVALVIREHDFHATILRAATLRGVHVYRVLVTVALDLNPLFLDPQIGQYISDRLCSVF